MSAAATAFRYSDPMALQGQTVNNFARQFTKRLHLLDASSSSSSVDHRPRHETYDVENTVTNPEQNRTLRQRAPIDEISEREFARIVSDALQAHYGPMKASAKCCANDAGASVPTAKNWLTGLCPPSSVYLKRLEAKVPGLAAEMRRLTAMEAELHHDLQRDLMVLLRKLQALEG